MCGQTKMLVCFSIFLQPGRSMIGIIIVHLVNINFFWLLGLILGGNLSVWCLHVVLLASGVRLTGQSKLCHCLCLYVSPKMNWWLVRGVGEHSAQWCLDIHTHTHLKKKKSDKILWVLKLLIPLTLTHWNHKEAKINKCGMFIQF